MAGGSKEGTEREPGLFVKQGTRLHAKMLSKEAAAQLAVPSFRVYYSVASAGAVPFLWESQPGTPKNDSSSAAALPPLTPPPSYYAAGGGKNGSGGGRSEKRRGAAIFTFLRRRPGPTAPCSASSSSSSSSSSRSTSSTMSPVFTVQSSPSPRAGAGSRGRHHRRTSSADADDARCFGTMEHDECCDRGIAKGCSVVGAVRNALATVVGGAKPAARRA